MRMILAACAVIAAGAAALGSASSVAAADLSGLERWVGKYPSDRIAGRRFFDHAGLRAEMQKTMGAEAYRALQQMRGPEGPVARAGDHIGAWRCQQHDCGDKNSTVIARIGKGDVVVCWQHAPERPRMRWYIPGRPPLDESGEGCPQDGAALAAAIRRLGL